MIILKSSGSWERGVELKGGSLHDGFDGFGGSGQHLALLSLVLRNTAVLAVMVCSVMTATPAKLNTPFP